MALLEAKGLGIRFGGLKAVDEFNFEIDENQLFGLIGPNVQVKLLFLTYLQAYINQQVGVLSLQENQ